MTAVQQHFVHFYSPGTFMSEESVQPIDNWDVEEAKRRAATVLERHGATPYGFSFTTRGRGPDDLDSKVTARSPRYFLGGKVRTLAEVEADNLPDEHILRSNMRCNEVARCIVNNNSWRFTTDLRDDDVVLDWTPPPRPEAA